MPGGGVLSALQKLATSLQRLEALSVDFKELRTAFTARIERVESQVSDLRERLARLEATREADFAKLQAEAARFKAEIERAELRLTKQLPDSSRGAKSKGA